LAVAGLPASAADFDPFSSAAIEDRLGASLPNDVALTDADGRNVTLADYGGGRPMLLAPVDFDCQTICGVTLAGLMDALGRTGLEPGSDFELVALGIDPEDGPKIAAAAKAEALKRYDRKGAGGAIHFLGGATRPVTDALGFRFAHDEATGQYSHAAAVAVITPDRRLARWLYGYPFEPADLRLALAEAGGGTIGRVADRLWLLCYSYDPTTGQYSLAIDRALKVGCSLTALLVAAFVLLMLWRERRQGAAS
jgi:protein SCO1/2